MSQAGAISSSGGSTGNIQTLTGNDLVAVSPTANNINLLGSTVANGTNAIPVFVKNTTTSTESIQVQLAKANASSVANNAGIASFNSANFTVDANGFVSTISSGGVTGPVSSTVNAVATWANSGGTALLSPPSPLISSGGVMTNSNQPAFAAYFSANQTNATGDGTALNPVNFDSTQFNQGSGYSAGVFTAPVTGIYQFSGIVYVTNLGAGHNAIVTEIIMTAASYIVVSSNPGADATSTQNCYGFSFLSKMTAGDTAKMYLAVGGSTKTVTVVGGLGGTTLTAILVA